MDWLAEKVSKDLADIRENNLFRETKTWQARQAVNYQRGDARLVNFCSNDYLGLSDHPKVVAAYRQGAERYGYGAGSADLITGHSQAQNYFAEQLAEFTGAEAALLFSSGYIANLSCIDALTGQGDVIHSDALNHASLIDGCRISKARTQAFGHLDYVQLRQNMSSAAHNLVVSDTVFSMDGDLAPLPELLSLAKEFSAATLLDDAHGFGVLGAGRGSLAHFNLPVSAANLQTITFGKALGGQGAAVIGSGDMIDFLRNRARGYIFSTAAAPANFVAMSTALTILAGTEGDALRSSLAANTKRLRAGLLALGLETLPSDSAIHAVVLGSESAALNAADALAKNGYWVAAIRPPTVPAGTSRLRITVSAMHTEADVDGLLAALGEIHG